MDRHQLQSLLIPAMSAALLLLAGTPFCHAKIPAIYAIGDDLLDTGNRPFINTTLAATFPPFGMTYFQYATGRSTDGRLALDFIAEFFRLPLLPPYLKPNTDISRGTSFATSVTTTLSNITVPVGQVTLDEQLKSLKDLKEASTSTADREQNAAQEEKFAEALYVISLGITDYKALLDYPYLQEMYTTDEFVALVVNVIAETVRNLITDIGARKLLVFNVEAFGCRPVAKATALDFDSSYSGSGCYGPANNLAQFHNFLLGQQLGQIRSDFPNVTLIEANIYNLNVNVVDNPQQYGFTNSNDSCCGGGVFNGVQLCAEQRRFELGGILVPSNYPPVLCNDPGQYVYFNLNFFSERFNYIMASEILMSSDVAYPFPLARLASM